MRVLDNYILKSIISVFMATILIFAFLYILIDAASNLDEIIGRKVSLQVLVQYYASFFPIILTQTASIACLIATILTFSRLNNNNEVIALRSSGLSFWKITRPALWFCLLVSVFLFWINERFVPTATTSSEQIRDENIILASDKQKKQTAPIKNLTFYGFKNRLYFIDSFNPRTYELEGITIIEQDSHQNPTEKINALSGKWIGIAWKFSQCQVNTFDPANINTTKKIKYYPEKLMDIKETPQDFLKQKLNLSTMNIHQLHDYIKRISNSGATKAIRERKVDLYQKIAFPFTTIAIVLVGMPLALLTGRRKAFTFTSLGIAIAAGFFFKVIEAVGLALGKDGALPPILSAGLAPLIFLGIGIYLIRTRF